MTSALPPAPPPARVGQPLAEIDTPALVVDLDVLERNLDAMAVATRGRGVDLRPHAKAHKCVEIAAAQLARGAVGVCCQTVREAEAMVAGGIPDVLVTNEVVGADKLARLATLAQRARVAVLADDARNVTALAAAAVTAGVTLRVLIELDVGANRCGVVTPEAAVVLARAIAAAPALELGGIHAYHGGAQHRRTPPERIEAIASAIAIAREAQAAIEAAGIACPTVTGAGTGTWMLERDSGIYTELQPGSYVLMDVDYGRNVLAPDAIRFEQSLFVLASVISAPLPTRIVVDAGLKALAFDSGLPLVHGREGLTFQKASDEHGVIAVGISGARPGLGDKVFLVPGHCDPTVNLYDWIVGLRGGRVECVWAVAGRGH